MRRDRALVAMVVVSTALAACGGMTVDEAAARAEATAQGYVDGYYAQFPEEAYETGYPSIPWDHLGDRSLPTMAEWEAQEDAFLAALEELDEELLRGTDAWIPYGFALQRLRSSVDRRVCRTELWNVSPTWTGWQSLLPSSFAQQPVTAARARVEALARLRDVSRYLEVETENLREGLRLGYTAPRSNVDAVIVQLNAMLGAPVESSPFFEPGARDGNEPFMADVRDVVRENVEPAIEAYRDFLREEYRPLARSDIGVTTDPGGLECYRASVRFWSTLDPTPEEIQESGLREMERIQTELSTIAERTFGTDDVRAVLQLVRTDSQYTFASEQAVIDYAQAAVDRGAAAAPDWFGFVPDAEVVLRPYPAFQRRSGGGFYSAGAEDGSRPGTYEFGTYEPRSISLAGMEATAFHETYPGHHLQVSVALMGGSVHPVLKYFFSSGLGEGWALYTERLADEMGLYSGDVDRLGMLSNEALRAARLVVDPGMHVLGWSRQRAIDYMLDHTAESRRAVTSEVDRYIAVPGQATSYLMGSLEIQRLRADAEGRLGTDFDIRAFHDRVLANGTVTLPMLATVIEDWLTEQGR